MKILEIFAKYMKLTSLSRLSKQQTILFGLIALAVIAAGVSILQLRGKTAEIGAYGYNNPNVTLFARIAGSKNSFSTGPIQVTPTQKVELKWASNNVDNCTSNWAQGKIGANGTAVVGPYTVKNAPLLVVSCTSPQGTVKDTLQVIVGSFGY